MALSELERIYDMKTERKKLALGQMLRLKEVEGERLSGVITCKLIRSGCMNAINLGGSALGLCIASAF